MSQTPPPKTADPCRPRLRGRNGILGISAKDLLLASLIAMEVVQLFCGVYGLFEVIVFSAYWRPGKEIPFVRNHSRALHIAMWLTFASTMAIPSIAWKVVPGVAFYVLVFLLVSETFRSDSEIPSAT